MSRRSAFEATIFCRDCRVTATKVYGRQASVPSLTAVRCGVCGGVSNLDIKTRPAVTIEGNAPVRVLFG